MTGRDGKHKKTGTKISLFTDKNGLPADVAFGKGSQHDTAFVANHIKKTAGRRKYVLHLDNGYTGVEFRRQMRKKGTKINMETKHGDYTRKRGPKFSFDKEIRQDRLPAIYKGFVYLGLIIILLRQN